MFVALILSIIAKGGSPMLPTTWCQSVLSHGALAQDLHGNLFVMDGWQLRKFADRSLKKWYATGRSPICIIKSADAAQYQHGNDIIFRPDQDLQYPMLLRVPNRPEQYLWTRGRIHQLKVPSKTLPLTDHRFYTISQIAIDSLPHGPAITTLPIIEGTAIRFQEKTFIHSRNGIRPIKPNLLSQLNLTHKKPQTVSADRFKELPRGKPFKLINSYSWPNNVLIRGSHPERIYLLQNNKRYYLWSRSALQSRGWESKPVKQLTDDELYLIPYAGNLY